MDAITTYLPETQTILRFAIDLTAMLTLLFGLYYRRYRDKELVTTAAMFINSAMSGPTA